VLLVAATNLLHLTLQARYNSKPYSPPHPASVKLTVYRPWRTAATTHRHDSRETKLLTSTMGIPDRQHAASVERRLIRAVGQECNWTVGMWVCRHARCNIACGSNTSLCKWFCFVIWSFSPSKTGLLPNDVSLTARFFFHHHRQQRPCDPYTVRLLVEAPDSNRSWTQLTAVF